MPVDDEAVGWSPRSIAVDIGRRTDSTIARIRGADASNVESDVDGWSSLQPDAGSLEVQSISTFTPASLRT